MPWEEERAAGREVVRYGPRVIWVHWAVMIVFVSLSVTALLLLRDWIFAEFNIIGGDLFIETFDGALDVHMVLGLLLLVLGLVHVLLHIGQKDKSILPRDLMEDFRATVHTIRYVVYLSKWDEKGAAHKYKGNQRISYLGTFYTVALAGITGAFVHFGTFEELGIVLHVVSGVLVLTLSAYRFAHLLRKREWIAWRSILVSGKMPEWFVKQNHPRWYEELFPSSEGNEKSEQEGSGPEEPEPRTPQSEAPTSEATRTVKETTI